MSSLISSFSDANIGLLQPIQDAYDLWYQQGIHFYDYGQHQQSTQPGDAQHPIEPNQPQEHYNSYDRPASNMLQNHIPPSTAQPSRDQPQKAPQNRKMHVFMKDMDGKSDRNHDMVFRHRPGACTQCKQVKMKCDFAPGEQACQRCKSKGYHCIVEAPKPKKDAVIERLLKQLHNPYLATPHSIEEYVKSISPSDANNSDVVTWLDCLESSIQIDKGNSKKTSIYSAPGLLLHDQLIFACSKVQQHKEMSTLLSKNSHGPVQFRPEYEAQEITPRPGMLTIKFTCADFRPGSLMGLSSPEILVLGIVTLADAEQLFDIFYTYIHPFIPILDPVLLTPKSTLAWCPVLFMVICTIASRYHPQKSSIYQIAMHFAKHSAANGLILDEMKSIELCQAYILMSIYTAPEKSWDRDQTWLYMGLAISPHLAGLSSLGLRVINTSWKALDDEGGYNYPSFRGVDVTMRYDGEIENFKEEWKRKFKAEGVHRGAMFRRTELHFYIAYFKLVMFSFGFHQVFHAGIEAWYDYFFTKCFEHAKSVITCMDEDLVPSGFMRYAPDRQFMSVAFAVVFLIKLLRPEFSSLLDQDDKDESIKLIEILIDKLSSLDVSVDDKHTPKVYARFLATILRKYQHDGQEKVFGGARAVLPGNTGISSGGAGEPDKESSDNCQKLYVAQGDAYADFGYWPEATHAMSNWPCNLEVMQLFCIPWMGAIIVMERVGQRASLGTSRMRC
ncbi:hypothetical protein F5146DRAFT_1004265 [Armillaria mellea]|nr:hypothetical protein F5146DRAFT_1004265 [Armillaria mellea]